MKTTLSTILLLLVSVAVNAQIFISKTCQVTFFSEAPLENIQATNTTAKPILNTANNEVAVRVPIKAFTFEKSLMQEHFNENYMESNKFPYGTFKGKINEQIDFTKDGSHKVTITGKLYIHGVEKDRTLNANVIITGEQINVSSEFLVELKDHNITVPKVVFQNIAEKILVKLQAEMIPYKK